MGAQAHAQLQQVVDEHCRQLDELPSIDEIERVKELQEEFVRIMGMARAGMTRSDVVRIKDLLVALAKKIARTRKDVGNADSAKALDELLQAVATNVKQIEDLLRQ
jgi:hypothetical protein